MSLKNSNYLIFIVFWGLVLSATAGAGPPVIYKKKVQVVPLQNPAGWVGTYNPGALISHLLQDQLQNQENVVLVRIINSPGRKQNEKGKAPDTGAVRTPAQIIISGRIIKYRPALPVALESTKTEKRLAHSAEVQIEFQILQGQTQRPIQRFVLSQKSTDGEFPLGYSRSSLVPGSPDFKKSYMGKALTRMAEEIMPLLADYLNRMPLDGQVIVLEEKEDRMIINVGWKSGVEIRDDFVVYGVDVNYTDPLYHEDIGDRLTKLGVVRVIEVHEGFSEAAILAGGDFVPGNLVRSKESKPIPKFMDKGTHAISAPVPR